MLPSPLHDFVKQLIRWIGDNPDRHGLASTPDRFLGALKNSLSGYEQSIKDLVSKDSFITNCGYDDMIIAKRIDIFSYCEHHIVPIRGSVSVGYIPGNAIIGISSIYKIIHTLSRRLQMQEKLTVDIAQSLSELLNPKGVIISIKARHDCVMHSTGGGHLNDRSSILTSHATGVFKDSQELRMEFFQRS